MKEVKKLKRKLPLWWPSKNNYVIGETLSVLKSLPDGVVQCVVTSPPYWALRDYGTASWEGGDPNCDHINPKKRSTTYKTSDDKRQEMAEKQFGTQFRGKCGKCGAIRVDDQIGLEPTPEDYVGKLVEVFREVRRVLRDDGTFWLNIGDSYNGSGGPGSQYDSKASAGQKGDFQKYDNPNRNYKGLKPKDLVGIPWRLAFALQEDGWYLRSDIIWSKPNPMPESVEDRPTKAHEYIFLLTKSAKYYYDYMAIREPASYDGRQSTTTQPGVKITGDWRGEEHSRWQFDENGKAYRNRRTVWTIATQPYSGAHFATFPEELPETCIKAGTSLKGCCAKCGKPLERKIERSKAERTERTDNPNVGGLARCPPELDTIKTVGWEATCDCHTETVPCIVLDPFLGSGTTVWVARNLGRVGIGIELNPKYEKLIRERTRAADKSVFDFKEEEDDIAQAIRNCVLAGTSPEGACPKCGAPMERIVETKGIEAQRGNEPSKVARGMDGQADRSIPGGYRPETKTVGWRKTCECDVDAV